MATVPLPPFRTMDFIQPIISAFAILSLTSAAPSDLDTSASASLRNIANVSYGAESIASLFSPRMDFDQWKPLTGRGDPLRNDPTYDYEPPLLERVHYWADDPGDPGPGPGERRPERKSEVLMLGVSSRKPSAPRQPPRRHNRKPPKYEDYTYRVSEHYPMTILVPPPPPPPGHQPTLFVLDAPAPAPPASAPPPEQPESLFAVQEASLVYQSSTTSHGWAGAGHALGDVSSDYAGWGPTTPSVDDADNDTLNLIFSDSLDVAKPPFSFHQPTFSEPPPPPQIHTFSEPPPSQKYTFSEPPPPHKPAFTEPPPPQKPMFFQSPPPLKRKPTTLPTFVPTSLPTTTEQTYTNFFTETEPTTYDYTFDAEPTETKVETTTKRIVFVPTAPPSAPPAAGMLRPMLSMPLVAPERPQDHLYAHASETTQVYKENNKQDVVKLESMQTMQPPPQSTPREPPRPPRPFHVDNHVLKNPIKDPPSKLDPFLNMRYTTAAPAAPEPAPDAPAASYLIIQGHSKVKTYSSKNKNTEDNESSANEVPKPNETSEVKHLHPRSPPPPPRRSVLARARGSDLKHLIDKGHGSIEIQEANIGIKYDVSDGGDVPVEIYRKGIVESDPDNYPSKAATKPIRPKRGRGEEAAPPGRAGGGERR